MEAPRIQHQTTLAGPPVSKGVLKVVATDETRPMMENAKEMVARFENSRLKEPVRIESFVRGGRRNFPLIFGGNSRAIETYPCNRARRELHRRRGQL
jgi:hypothetical protein